MLCVEEYCTARTQTHEGKVCRSSVVHHNAPAASSRLASKSTVASPCRTSHLEGGRPVGSHIRFSFFSAKAARHQEKAQVMVQYRDSRQNSLLVGRRRLLSRAASMRWRSHRTGEETVQQVVHLTQISPTYHGKQEEYEHYRGLTTTWSAETMIPLPAYRNSGSRKSSARSGRRGT